MSLTPGTRLGVYEIAAQIGEGGMGQVFRATDTKLKRQVAIKILPPSLAADADRLARFQREAEVLASLSHPNIAGIYGLEESGGMTALVMELVEGEDLSRRISRGPIPIDEALPIAKQIAEALEAAHEQNIVHRDLKPANIKVRDDGTVKVLDFGLAKAMEPAAGSSPSVSMSPTITTPAMTRAGMILGTASYMSPEQARGKTVDKRADIWAFGVVLFEMLTGRRLFHGETISDTLASVLKTDPDWRTLPAGTPAALQRLLRRCLEKDPKRRLQAIGEARAQIEDIVTGVPEAASAPAAPRALPVRARVLPWAIATVAVVTAAGIVLTWAPWTTAPAPATVRLSAVPATDVAMAGASAFGSFALSPDGTMFAFVGAAAGTPIPQIFARRLSQLQATPLPGTAGATTLFFSPDGQWVAFFAEGKLKRAPIAGGSVITIANAPNARGGWWGEDGAIVFAGDTSGALSRVPWAGGSPQPASTLATGEVSHRWPQVIDGGKALLYSASTSPTAWATASIVAVRIPSGVRTVVQTDAYGGRYLPNGYLLFMREGVEYGGLFDVERMAFKTSPVPVLDGVRTAVATGGVQLAFAQNGTVVYLPGAGGGQAAPIVWMNRDGETAPLRQTVSDWSNPQFSPDGSRLAMDIRDGANLDVFVYDWARDALSRLTFGPEADEKPIWSRDGRRIAFASARGSTAGVTNLFFQRADGAGEAERLTTSTNAQLPGSWHPSGRFLAFTEVRPGTGNDLMILPLEGNDASGWKPGAPTVFLSTPASESEPMFSPDGRWIAYQSNEGGTTQVYVRPFPGPGGMWQVSANGGTDATWSRAQAEILFRPISAAGVMAASYKANSDSFVADPARLWARAFLPTRPRQRSYDLSLDGNRLATSTSLAATAPAPDKLVFVFNFFDELKRLAPAR